MVTDAVGALGDRGDRERLAGVGAVVVVGQDVDRVGDRVLGDGRGVVVGDRDPRSRRRPRCNKSWLRLSGTPRSLVSTGDAGFPSYRPASRRRHGTSPEGAVLRGLDANRHRLCQAAMPELNGASPGWHPAMPFCLVIAVALGPVVGSRARVCRSVNRDSAVTAPRLEAAGTRSRCASVNVVVAVPETRPVADDAVCARRTSSGG